MTVGLTLSPVPDDFSETYRREARRIEERAIRECRQMTAEEARERQHLLNCASEEAFAARLARKCKRERQRRGFAQ